MNKVLEYFKNLLNDKPFEQDITVYGWTKNYEHKIISSIVPYLFEDLVIKENIASIENENRDGRIREKKYIVIHDTGDVPEYKDAFYWSEVVRTQINDGNPYAASFQYVVGNDGIYHNIPDNEIAYHAGDTTHYDYALYDTKIKASDKCNITIKNGMYFINDICTNIECPKVEGLELSEKDINDYGILCIVKDGTYHIGETYFNNTYKKIANRGGNNNGIGMEVCINEGSDVYLNWQLSSKLTAYLLDKNNLTMDDIKPHHYFSGKDCPMTLRKNNLWNHFMKMVEVEYNVLQFIKEGYTIKLIPQSDNILENGRIKDLSKPLKFKIVTTFNGIEETYE